MIDLSEKSKEEIIREKKEAELRLAKRREGEWKRRKDKESKCMIGGTFVKYLPDALLFEADEWDRIVKTVIATDAFKQVVDAIRKEAKAGKNDPKQTAQPERERAGNGNQNEKQKAGNGNQEQKHEGGNNGQ